MTKPFSNMNAFDLSHEDKLTCHMGQLVPCLLEEVVPGDIYKWKADMFARLMPLVAPMMQDVDFYIHCFFVPSRVLFKQYEDYFTGGREGTSSVVKPYLVAPVGGFAVGSLADYLGLPTGVAGIKVSALPFRAYQKIYNDWYRDNNLIDEVVVSTDSGEDTTTSLALQRRAWHKDYFTSALPWAQRGDPVYLPLGTTAPVVSNGNTISLTGQTHAVQGNLGISGQSGTSDVNVLLRTLGGLGTSVQDVRFGSVTGLQADLTTATAATINDMRLAFQMQRFMEKNARGGARYIEWLLAHFNVHSSDARLQRSEYLGGGKAPLSIGEVLQTSSTDTTSPQGNMAGRAISGLSSLSFTKRFEEYGYILGILSIIPKASYQQGIRRLWSRESRYDEYLPVFAHLGNQEVKNKELYAQAPTVLDASGQPVNEDTFGYQERFEEFRRHPSQVCGQFKTTLNFWHQGRIFDSLPTLSQSFIECNPSKRVFAVTDANEDEVIVKIDHHVVAVRPIPKFGNPGLIDHD